PSPRRSRRVHGRDRRGPATAHPTAPGGKSRLPRRGQRWPLDRPIARRCRGRPANGGPPSDRARVRPRSPPPMRRRKACNAPNAAPATRGEGGWYMAEEHAPGSRLDVHLPDGGHVTVAVEIDDDISADVELAVANAVILSGEAESELEAAV